MRPQQRERAKGISLAPGERAAALARQRFRQDEQPIAAIGETERSSYPERQARIDDACEPAQRGAEHETRSKRDAEKAEAGRTLIRLGDVGDVGVRGRDA